MSLVPPSGVHMRGAVDLSSLVNRPAATVPGAPGEAPLAASAVPVPSLTLEGTDANFGEVLELSMTVPVIVDLWAEWCEPCKALTPALEQAAEARAGTVVLAKVDVDANQALAQEFGVRGIPAVKAFRKGRIVSEFTGVQSPQSVEAFFDALFEPSEGEKLLAELRESDAGDPTVTALERGDFEAALAGLFDRVRAATGDEQDVLKRRMVAIFGELGQEHPLAVEYRRALAATLY